MADPRRDIAAGVVIERTVAYVLAVLHGGYGLLLARYGADLWALSTYGPALSVPGGVVTWGVVAMAAAAMLAVGTVLRRETIVGAGATLSALWLTFFAIMFGVAALHTGTPVALPGVLIYACVAVLAAARAGTAIGRR